MEKISRRQAKIYLLSICIIAGGALVGWYLQQPSLPVHTQQRPVTSGSMADADPGPHLLVQCYDCQLTYRCDMNTVSSENQPVCYNCGATNSISGLPGHLSQVVYQDSLISRWSKVVFKPLAEHADKSLMLKRVIGLPGEKIRIDHGELWINDKLYQKSIQEFDTLRVPVFDSRHRPQDPQFSFLKRFAVGAGEQAWLITTEGQFAFDAEKDESLQWLEYIHWNTIAGFVPGVRRGSPTAIFDYHPYNQYISRPQLNFVDDYVVDITIATRAVPVLWMRFQDVEIAIDFKEQKVTAFQGVHICGSKIVSAAAWQSAEPLQVRAGRFDKQIFVQVDSEELYFDFNPVLPSAHYGQDLLLRRRPFAVGATTGTLDVQRIVIARDIYWLAPNGLDNSWELPERLPRDTFFVAGDNQPVSRDSRHWEKGITTAAIQGVVMDESPAAPGQ